MAALGLETVTDPSNFEPRFRRNRVRHEILPLLADVAGRDPVPLLARTAGSLAEDADLLSVLARASTRPTPPLCGRRPSPWPSERFARGCEGQGPSTTLPHRPSSTAREVVTGERVACELTGGRRVSRSRGRLRVSSGRLAAEV